MSRELCHQQEALWELLTTELIYVRKLKIMTDVSPEPASPRSFPLSPSPALPDQMKQVPWRGRARTPKGPQPGLLKT